MKPRWQGGAAGAAAGGAFSRMDKTYFQKARSIRRRTNDWRANWPRSPHLLKNEGELLPLESDVKSIAVIGPNAAEAVIEGGGSSKVLPLYRSARWKRCRNRLATGKDRICQRQRQHG